MIDSKSISLYKKNRFLLEMSEDDFRDKVIRPVFLKAGLKDGRDLCGIGEKGKDCIFVDTDKLGQREIIAVQTKKGNLNLSSKVKASIIPAVAQLTTALETKIPLLETREKIRPNRVMLCVSGTINDNAKNHIIDNISDGRIDFFDRDRLIPLIDDKYPELWYDIDTDKLPYFKNLTESLAYINENAGLADLISTDSKATIITDEKYVRLKIIEQTSSTKKYKGKVISIPKIDEFPEEGLLKRKGNLFLLLGEAGSGKSTVLKRLAYILASKSAEKSKIITLPILLRAVDICEKSQKLVDICQEETQKISGTANPSFSADDLVSGSIYIMIDALDEIGDPVKQRYVLKKIDDFIQEYPACRVIITSRDYTYIRNLEELAKYKELRLTSLNFKQAKGIIQRLAKKKSLPKELLQETVRRLQDVHGLELNPLLVTVFVATSDYSRKDIPANITEIFKKFTEMMLGRWDSSKGLSQQYQFPLKDFLLEKLAYEMHQRKVTQISEAETVSIFTQELEKRGKKEHDIKRLIHEIIDRSGLFRHVEDKIEFRHLLLQEFFAGRGIPSPDIIPLIIKDPWWRRAIIFYFGEKPDDVTTLEKILSDVRTVNSYEQFQTTVTVGLSLQACYLVETVKKLELLKWVILNLALIDEKSLLDEVMAKKFPLLFFIHYYMFGKDSVASDILTENKQAILDELIAKNKDSEERIKFWTIVGLIESGSLDEAEKEIKKFNPEDKQLLLALHLGCFLIESLKIYTEDDQKTAKRICDHLSPSINDLRMKVINEFTSELLEVRNDKIKAIEDNRADK